MSNITKKHNYPDYIKSLVSMQMFDLEEGDKSKYSEIDNLSPNEVFSSLLIWEGIIGYDYTILSWIKDVYGVELK